MTLPRVHPKHWYSWSDWRLWVSVCVTAITALITFVTVDAVHTADILRRDLSHVVAQQDAVQQETRCRAAAAVAVSAALATTVGAVGDEAAVIADILKDLVNRQHPDPTTVSHDLEIVGQGLRDAKGDTAVAKAAQQKALSTCQSNG